MYSIKKITCITGRLKKKIKRLLKKQKYETALVTISACARLLYSVNQTYYDADLENSIQQISQEFFKEKYEFVKKTKSNLKDCILFYDGFGFDNRGLAQIYLEALAKTNYIIYVTNSRSKNSIQNITKIVTQSGELIFLDEKSYLQKMVDLKKIVDVFCPSKMFLYTTPDDVVGIGVFNYYDKKILRYQINLTDHAFWLGVNAFDYCLEFRNYGASISCLYRHIDINKIRVLPFYPKINYNVNFQGFPFSFDKDKQKLIFSGGSLYKTLGGENRYYHIVRYILANFIDTVFWYAGSGDTTELNKLIKEYPNRVFITDERSDFYQIILKCFFYLSTYPIVGGLMFQYAAAAGKVPLTLKYDDCSNDFLINQKELGIEFESLNDLFNEIDYLFNSPDELNLRGECLKKSVISKDIFESNIKKLLNEQRTDFKVVIYDVNVKEFQENYLKRFKFLDFCEIFRSKAFFWSIFKTFPVKTCFSCLYTQFKRMKFRRTVSRNDRRKV